MFSLLDIQAEKFRAKAQRPEQSRSHTQYCRYLYYLGRIKAIQLEYTDARDYLQQAARKVSCQSVDDHALPMNRDCDSSMDLSHFQSRWGWKGGGALQPDL